MVYGYARVSTDEQNLELQCKALKEAGVSEKNIVTEKLSGTIKSQDRPELSKLLGKMKDGDELVIWKLDRLGRNVIDLLELDEQMRERNIFLRSLTENLDTGTVGGKFYYTLLAALAEMERNLTAERIRAGIDAARNSGKAPGRRDKLSAEEEKQLIEAYKDGLPVKDIQELFGITAPTMYKYLRKQEKDLTRYSVCRKIMN